MEKKSLEKKFLEVLEDHKKLIYKVAHSYCNAKEERPDLVQEIVVELWRSFPNYDPAFKYSTWVCRIALNVAISFFRKNKKRSIFKSSLENKVIDLKVTEETDEEKKHQIEQLYQFINQLRELDRALMLLILDEKSHEEIADILGISKSNVGTKVGRIKIKLKESFNQKIK